MYKLNVLVLDSDIAQRIRLKKQLNDISPPLNSITMSTCDQLIKFFSTLPDKQQHDHFLICIDSNLADNETQSTIERLDEQFRAMMNIRVIIMGASASSKILELSESSDMVIDYLTKPIRKKDILRLIKAIEPRYA